MGEDLREKVRERYAEAARTVRDAGESGSCCESSCCGSDPQALEVDMTGGSYSGDEKRELPRAAVGASLGCGNPVALAELSPGEVVLDLGSGGGIDVLLSARRVSPGGKAYGLDMTDEMLALARENAREAGAENVEFLKGEIEAVPLPDEHVDVVISNCVINLSTQKEAVIREAYRVLKPGGRFAVSDVVFLGKKSELPAGVARSVELWAGCVSGALEKSEYERLLSDAGFEEVSVEVTHTYEPELISGPEDVEALRAVPVASAFIRARKPDRVARLVALGRALSDPIRVRMLGVISRVTATGRGCCDLPDLGVPLDEEDENIGVCVCEFEGYYGMGQSKVSYHLGKLKEAGLVKEKKRGKWSFYSLDREAAGRLLAVAAEQLGVLAEEEQEKGA